MFDNVLSQRVTSAFPLSIGTSYAFESLFDSKTPTYDENRERPKKVDINQYSEFWINVYTLIRNAHNSLKSDLQAHITLRGMFDTIKEEIDFIISLLKKEGSGILKPVFYVCTYSSLTNKTKNPYSLLRTDNTPKQLVFKTLVNDTINELLAHYKNKEIIKVFDSSLNPDTRQKALILTHIAQDLTSYKKFAKLDLIESHTGVLKDRYQFYTKYTKGKDLQQIPFLEGLLKIFGDNEHHKSYPPKDLEKILLIAKQKNWSQATGREKVLFDIDINLKDPYLKDIFKSVM